MQQLVASIGFPDQGDWMSRFPSNLNRVNRYFHKRNGRWIIQISIQVLSDWFSLQIGSSSLIIYHRKMSEDKVRELFPSCARLAIDGADIKGTNTVKQYQNALLRYGKQSFGIFLKTQSNRLQQEDCG